VTARGLATPWAPTSRAYSLPGSMLLKLRLGEAPEGVPTQWDVRARRAAPATKLDGGVIDRLIRHYANGAQVARVHAAAASLLKSGERHKNFDDREHAFGLSRTFRVDMDRGSPIADLVSALSEVSVVESATLNYVASTPFEVPPAATSTPDLERAHATRALVRAREALALESGDPAVMLGIVDSGIRADHAELRGRLRAGFDTVQLGSDDFAPGLKLLGDLTHPDTRPVDRYVGHGMGCAGIIGAVGQHIPPGLAGLCPLIPIRVLAGARVPAKQDAVGVGAICDIDAGLKMAIDLGAKVLNLSFGTADDALDPGAPRPHEDLVRYASERGCVLVAASGNSGRSERFWPAAFDAVIAVGSVDLEGRPSAFTTSGDHVALCACGERVATCGLEGYQVATGTSFAAPFVSAAAALLVSYANRRSFPLSGDDVKRLLTSSARPFFTGPRSHYGSGVLDAVAALAALDREIRESAPELATLSDPEDPN
jgi:subtilisin family serine protease